MPRQLSTPSAKRSGPALLSRIIKSLRPLENVASCQNAIGCRRACVRLLWPLPASPPVQEIGVVLGRAEQGQDGLAPAPAVADMLDGQGADREAPARPALSTTRGDSHGVDAARHEAAPGKHNVLIT